MKKVVYLQVFLILAVILSGTFFLLFISYAVTNIYLFVFDVYLSYLLWKLFGALSTLNTLIVISRFFFSQKHGFLIFDFWLCSKFPLHKRNLEKIQRFF